MRHCSRSRFTISDSRITAPARPEPREGSTDDHFSSQPRPHHHRRLAILANSAAEATRCGNGPGGFNPWLGDFKRGARANSLSDRTLNRALSGPTHDLEIICLNGGERSFKESFAHFYKRRASPWLLKKARGKLERHARLLSAIENRYGMPPELNVTIWGMESTFGQVSGKMNIIRSLATLAYDCRHAVLFELLSPLRVVQRGDMGPARMRGGCADEIGQTQFLTSSYVKYAVDFDGNGVRDLTRSIPDVLASTTTFLKRHGWRRGEAKPRGGAPTTSPSSKTGTAPAFPSAPSPRSPPYSPGIRGPR